MTEIHGVTGAPYNTPQVRKKMPVPHSRPRIDLDGGRRVKRSWQDISVLAVRKGDTVAQFGTVADMSESVHVAQHTDTPTIWRVRLTNVMGEFRDYSGEQRVYAFVARTGDE